MLVQNNILIIEDELIICDILSYALIKEGFKVSYALVLFISKTIT